VVPIGKLCSNVVNDFTFTSFSSSDVNILEIAIVNDSVSTNVHLVTLDAS